MAKYVGIDLGTTTTVVAQMNERGESLVVPSWLDDQPYTHSAFWFDGPNTGSGRYSLGADTKYVN
jgi:molecular chaperone DnaK (HSP70)